MIKRLLPWIFMLILGGGLVTLNNMYLQQQRGLIAQERKAFLDQFGNVVPVVVTNKDLPKGHVITSDDVVQRGMSERLLPPTATDRPEETLGKTALVPFSAGEPLLRDKIAEKAEEEDTGPPVQYRLSELTPADTRAITIEVDEITGVGGFLKPGDFVDVLWTFKEERRRGDSEELVTLPIFQMVNVMAVGDQLMGSKAADEEDGPTGGRTVTLALKPVDASLLLYARKNGEITLSICPKDAKGKPIPAPVIADRRKIMEQVLGQQVREPAANREISVYKGLKQERQELSQ